MRRGVPTEAGPPRVAARSLRIRPVQEHMVRRLGQALVLQWDALSDEMQDLLIDQAVAVDDPGGVEATAEGIETFVRSVTTMALKPKAQAAEEEPSLD